MCCTAAQGVDVLLFVAAARAGLRPTVIRLLATTDFGDAALVDKLPSYADARGYTFAVSRPCNSISHL
jgi:hypothetical protein